MSAEESFRLNWPDGWPRTPPASRLGDSRFYGGTYGLSVDRSRRLLILELERLGAVDIVLTRAQARHESTDPGVAVYFTLRKRPLVMARDQFVSLAGNMRSLGLAVEAMRQLARHGGDQMMERAFTGFVAIAPPDWKKPWREVFGVKPDWIGDVRALFRDKARHRHPDAGGNDDLMAELNIAYEEAKAELNQ